MPCFRSLAILLLGTALATAGDWPQWLGPQRDSGSPDVVAAWKETPKVLWRAKVGDGHSSPVVADGKVFLHVKAKDKEREEVVAFDAVKGDELWRTGYDRTAFKSVFGAGPRGTPAVVDGKVYSFGVTGLLTCFDSKGNQVWQVDTLKKFNAANLFFGASCSPIVEGDNVIVNVGGKGASIVAFSKDKGETAWQVLDDKASYSSPVAFGAGKERQMVFLTGANLVSLNPADGSTFWKFPLVDPISESSTTPVKIGDVLLGSSVKFGSVGLKLASKEGKPTATELWKKEELTCYFSTPVAVGKEHVYMVTGEFGFNASARLQCVEASSGKVLWSKEKVGKYHAALLRTGDDKLLMLEDSGNLVLLEPNAKEYKEVVRAKVCGGTWAHPALSNGRLYVRDRQELVCVQLGETK